MTRRAILALAILLALAASCLAARAAATPPTAASPVPGPLLSPVAAPRPAMSATTPALTGQRSSWRTGAPSDPGVAQRQSAEPPERDRRDVSGAGASEAAGSNPASGANGGAPSLPDSSAKRRVPAAAQPAATPPAATPRILASGVASWGYGWSGVVTRLPQGTRIRVCGPLACWSGNSVGYGPAAWTGRIADLSRAVFARICGDPAIGLCAVTVTLP